MKKTRICLRKHGETTNTPVKDHKNMKKHEYARENAKKL